MKGLDPIVKVLKKVFSPGLILSLVFLALVAFEVYLLYYKVYGNLSTTVEEAFVENKIVRLNVNNYNKLVELMDEVKTFAPTNVISHNPFQ